MPDEKSKLFRVSLYDITETIKDEWERRTSAYCIATSLDNAALKAENQKDDSVIVIGVEEIMEPLFS